MTMIRIIYGSRRIIFKSRRITFECTCLVYMSKGIIHETGRINI